MWFLQPSDDPPRADGVGSRPWEAWGTHWSDTISNPFRTMEAMVLGVGWKSPLFSIGCCRLGTKPGKSWKRSLVESPPTLSRPESMVGNIMIERCGNLGIDRHLSPSFNWRNGGTGGLPSCGTWNQLPNGHLKKNCGNTGLTDSLAIWPLMLRTSQRWQQWWETEMTMRSSFIFWGMPALVPSGKGALL